MGDTNNRQPETTDLKGKIFTIPNILSFFRFCLVPVIAWLYCVKKDYAGTGGALLLSGITDIADGFIARTFHMTSDLGKILDPVADKVTQGVMLVCLVTRYPRMLVPLVLLIIKECFMGVTGALVIRKTGKVLGANWHGKVATVLLDAMMILHVLWYDIPAALSDVMISACIVMMLVSVVLYGIRNWKMIRSAKEPAQD